MAEPAFSRSQPLTEDEAYRWNQENAQLPVDRPWPTMFAGDGVSGYFGVPAEQSNGMVGDFVSGVMNAHPLSLAYRATQNAPDIAMAISDLSKRWRNDPQQMNPFRPGSDVREGIIGGANGAWNFATLPYQAFKHGMDSLEHGEGIASPSVTSDAIMAGLPSPAMGLVPGLGNGVATTSAFANAPKAAAPLAALLAGNAKTELSMDQASRMARAKEMGFDTDNMTFRGVESVKGTLGRGYFRAGTTPDSDYVAPYFADHPATAMSYPNPYRADPGVIPAYLRMKNPKVLDWGGRHFSDPSLDGQFKNSDLAVEAAKADGYDGAIIHNIIDVGPYVENDLLREQFPPTTVRVPFDPKNIRSVDAAFDPAQAHSANLLAANPVPTSVLSALLAARDNR